MANRKKKIIEIIIILIVLSIIGFAIYNFADRDNMERYNRTELILDTVFDVTIFVDEEVEGDRLLREAFDKVRALEKVMSRFVKNSDVDNINEQAGKEPVEVDPRTFYVIERSLEFGDASQGKFDVTIGPLLNLWGFGTGEEREPPSSEKIEETLPLVDYKDIELDEENLTVYLPREGMVLDLGGIAKGYIVDEIAEFLEGEGVEHGSVNAGGDIRALGTRLDGNPWRIGITHPRDRENLIAVIPVSQEAIVTSGDYERFFTHEGEIYHHILDPDTGRPAGEVTSVTVVAPDCITADSLSTAVFVLGVEEGKSLLESMPQVEGIIVDLQEEVYVTSGLKDLIEIR
ncbi:MAG: FAD:protein FMN transferase [Candidatus Syntrophonatronum acetioxidans]|uniref:FAD:protein FMN transferase n=1 Tax=Candidatus Syntrophonatronum acetioxidans TaxID=1795816 RepID=A0A424YBK2_9FIRM|nr:MAG: FAD:protein FMN transferase [Candidatus Syntrophonatronum acetioxidans]